MTDQEEQSIKEARNMAEEAERLVKEQGRKKVYLAREEAHEKASEASKTKRSDKRAIDEPGQLAKEQMRKKAYLAKEQAIAEAHEARKLKAKKQPPE